MAVTVSDRDLELARRCWKAMPPASTGLVKTVEHIAWWMAFARAEGIAEGRDQMARDRESMEEALKICKRAENTL